MAGFPVISVSQLNSYVKSVLESDGKLSGILLRGEISGCTVHRVSGHIYFTLKDEECAVKAVMFRQNASRLRFVPENGMSVIVVCDVSLYVRDGAYQLYVFDMQPDGLGSAYLALEQTKKKLAAEGLFDEDKKKVIPRHPEKIGVITAKGSAAMKDIINTVSRRYPCVEITVADVTVQGVEAVGRIVSAIEAFDKAGEADTLIIARGGGSAEDLWKFNDEKIVRAAYKCSIPIISAVGHESDFTLLDFVADLRAATPTAAAELATPDIRAMREFLDIFSERAEKAVKDRLLSEKEKVRRLKDAVSADGALKAVENRRKALCDIALYSEKCVENALLWKKDALCGTSRLIEGLGPMKTLMRGYAAVEAFDGKRIKSTSDVAPGDKVKITLKNGSFCASVTEVNKDE